MTSVAKAVALVRRLPRDDRTAKVNELLAGKAADPLELVWREDLITELRETGVWPQGCK